MGEQREGPVVPKREVLVFETTNECKVTEWPYETNEVRNKIIEEVSEALNRGDTVVRVMWDLDNLKGLNDVCKSHGNANVGIRLAAETAKKRLKGIETEGAGVQKILFWRPQSGGDEFDALMIIKKEQEVPIEKIKELVSSPVNFMYLEGEKAWQITASAGVAVRHEIEEGSKVGTIYQKMVDEAESEQNQTKFEKAEAYFEETRKMVSGSRLGDIEQVVEILVDRYGPRRAGKDMINGVLRLADAKRVTEMMEGKKPLTSR